MEQMQMRLPFKGEWYVFWGGDTKKQNAHHKVKAQKFALDFVKVDTEGKTYKGKGVANNDYYCFNQEILAPGYGEVAEVVDGIRDNIPGETNNYFLPGNYILIKHKDNRFSFLAHMRQGSIVVKAGDTVTSGQLVGRCGNSGNSGEPHLHYHLQDSFIFARFDKRHRRQAVAGGVKARFSSVDVNGINRKSYSPVKGDIVRQP